MDPAPPGLGAAAVVLATRNRHKVEELGRILAAVGLVLGPDEVATADQVPGLGEVAETGVTFADNALLKARAVAAASGRLALADDSGLCVDVMGGMPGVFSARWAGRHGDDAANLALLLAQLADVGPEHRRAHFACAVALAWPDGRATTAQGRLDGVLVDAPRGTNGFGYDPVFLPDGFEDTTAQMAPRDKDAISHRGRALAAIAPALAAALGRARRA